MQTQYRDYEHSGQYEQRGDSFKNANDRNNTTIVVEGQTSSVGTAYGYKRAPLLSPLKENQKPATSGDATAVVGSGKQKKEKLEVLRDAALVNTQSYRPKNAIHRRKRFRARQRIAKVTKNPRLAGCGCYRHSPEVEVCQRGDDSAFFRGVVTCGSVWLCPSCSARIRAARAAEMRAAFAAAAEQGLVPYTFLITVPHKTRDKLEDLLRVLLASSSSMTSGRMWQRLQSEWGIVGRIRNLEVTWGAKHGWHPHLHVVLFVEDGFVPGGYAERHVSKMLYERHCRTLKNHGFSSSLPQFHALSPLVDSDRVADYMAKIEQSKAASEMAFADMKAAYGQTPFQLAEAAVCGDKRALVLWRKYEAATKGKSFLHWGRGLRERLGLGAEETDDEIASDANTEAVVVAVIDAVDWHRVQRLGEQMDVLEGAEMHGSDGVERVLRRLRPKPPKPRWSEELPPLWNGALV